MGLVFLQPKLRGPRQPVPWDQVGQPDVSRLCAAGRLTKLTRGYPGPLSSRPGFEAKTGMGNGYST